MLTVCWIALFFRHPAFDAAVPSWVILASATIAFAGILSLPRQGLSFEWRPDSISLAFTTTLLVSAFVLLTLGSENVFIYFDF